MDQSLLSFSGGESKCEDIVYSNFANSYKNEIDDMWYPKGGIHVSKEACYNENRKINGRLINGEIISPYSSCMVAEY